MINNFYFRNEIIDTSINYFLVYSNSHAGSFSKKFLEQVFQVRSEINKDNLDNAVKLLGKIEIQNENEEEQINLLFGDIYLKINQPSKAEQFYEKAHDN